MNEVNKNSLPIFKTTLIDDLESGIKPEGGSIGKNYNLYINNDLNTFFKRLENSKNIRYIEPQRINVETFMRLQHDRNNEAKSDVENALKVYDALPDMTKSLASDKRIWIALTHLYASNYTKYPMD